MTDLWQQVLAQLCLQMTAQTFDTSLAKTSLVSEVGDTLTIHAESALAVDWLENRLRKTVERTASAVWQRRVSVLFVNGTAAPVPPSRGVEPEAAPAVGNLALMDLLSRPIWVKHPRYLTLFYQPYFLTFSRLAGPRAYPLWQYLRDRTNPDREYKIAWTPAWEVLLKDLAEQTGHLAQQMTGCWRPCPVFDQALAETGEPITCCLNYGGLGDRTVEGKCRYWAAGAFQLLVEHGLAVIHRLGTDSRNTRYLLQVYRKLPLLTPWQVARLKPAAQREHRDFIGAEFGIDHSVWQQIEAVSLMRLWREDTGLTLATEGSAVLNAPAFKNFFLPTF